MLGRSIAVVTLLLVGLSGCSGLPGAEKDDDGPVNYSAAGLAIVDVDLEASVVDLGDPFVAEATVVNQGDNQSADTLQVRLGETVLLSKSVDLEAKAFAKVTLEFEVDSYGEHSLTFAFGEGTQDVDVRVRAPTVEDIRFDYTNLACKANVPFTITFRNGGDGEARDVVVTARVVNMSEIEQSNGTKTIARVAAGKSATASFDLFAPDVCDQEDYFRVRATLEPRHLDPTPFVSEPFVL
jgi:hypothetical protein